jgi:putative phage-type endonuclease
VSAPIRIHDVNPRQGETALEAVDRQVLAHPDSYSASTVESALSRRSAQERAAFIWRPVSATIEACGYENREEWLAIRRTGIGSSDASKAAGISEYDDGTPLSLFDNKVGNAPDPDLSDNEAVYIGNKLEPFVAEMYEDRTGRRLRRSNRVLRRREHPFMLANIDRDVVGEKRLVEIKTVGFKSHGFISPQWGEDGSPDVPIDVYCQVQHQMAVTGDEICDVAAFLAGVGLHIHPIPRDEDAIAKLRALEAAFWRRVETNDPPPPITADEVQRLFPQHASLSVEADDEITAVAARYVAWSAQKADLGRDIEAAKDQIAAFLGEADTLLVHGLPVITYRTQSRKAYSVAESTSRVMRAVKEKK